MYYNRNVRLQKSINTYKIGLIKITIINDMHQVFNTLASPNLHDFLNLSELCLKERVQGTQKTLQNRKP